MSILIGINLDIGLIADLYSNPERCLQGFEELESDMTRTAFI
jgi:hypothetical protein